LQFYISDVFTGMIHYTEQQTLLNTCMETVHVFTIIFIDKRGGYEGKKMNQKLNVKKMNEKHTTCNK